MRRSERSHALKEATAIAERAGVQVIAHSRDRTFHVHRKKGTEIVTTVDLLSDEMIRGHLGSEFPGHRFFSEETADNDIPDFSGPVWVIDPLDGTSNFAHGHPYVSISIALVIDGVPVVGVVHAPFLNETYCAVRRAGATLNGTPIRVSQTTQLSAALVSTGFPHDRSDVSRPIERIRRLVTHCQDVRRAGSPALDISWVASGRLDAHTESLPPWDIAAAGLIATEAGAMAISLSDFDSTLPRALRGEDYVVATPGVFNELRELLSF